MGQNDWRRYERITQPLIRRNGLLQAATWEEALDRAAAGMLASVVTGGPDSIGMFSCSKATNEVNFIAQKLMRVALRSNNIDSCNRT